MSHKRIGDDTMKTKGRAGQSSGRQSTSQVEGAVGGNGSDQPDERKPYAKPEISHELELETRAGSPLGISPFDVLLDDPTYDPDAGDTW